ncbi:MAG: FAD-binding oxidoreductase [Pirellulaceae bacterium]
MADLPIKTTLTPANQAELAAAVAEAYAGGSAIYPIGGGTSLDFGLPAKNPGSGLSLAGLRRIVDYPARDMTVTVEAGVTMQTLLDLLATEGQRLPLGVPLADKATVGGVVATNWNGPRRYGCGTVRDYVIGISAVDGRGMSFKGGGRVVKNVAGYDFCKLLTGSLGTLGVITQVTFKVRPLTEQFTLMACAVQTTRQAEKLLAALVTSATTPAAIELLAGPVWDSEPALKTLAGASGPEKLYLVVGFEGSAVEVEWMTRRLHDEWCEQGIEAPITIGDATDFWKKLVDFPAVGNSPLVLKASLVPSGVTSFIDALRALDPQASIQSHAGNGIVIARLSAFPKDGLSRAIVGNLQPAAAAHRGSLLVLSNPSGSEMTHQSVWGGLDVPFTLMSEVKQKFDPKNILNPGRFVYV